MPSDMLWLIAGAFMIALEAFGIPGIGFLFAGIGAISAGLMTYLGFADGYVAQLGFFFGFTAISAAVLWKPLYRRKANGFSNMVGDMAVIADGGLNKGKIGNAIWSGTTMRAKIADDCGKEEFASGEEVIISAVQGNILIIKDK